MLNFLSRCLVYVLMVAIVAMGIPAPRNAWAAPAANCSNAYAANSGELEGCGAQMLPNGVPVPYTKLNWERVADAPNVGVGSGSQIVGEPETITMANRAAVALGLDASEVASAVQTFPSNVPLVFARYNPMDLTLRIDLIKIEKAQVAVGGGSEVRPGLYHAVFTPAHGDYWAAARAYIDPALQAAGNTPGRNPFAAFAGADRELFHSISLTGAQVAVGHAMRYVGAPFSMVSVAETRFHQYQKKSGNAFRKKVTTIIDGYAKSAWLIGYPAQFQNRSSSLPVAVICANDPRQSECNAYEIASAGVVFEQYEGGTLDDQEDMREVYRKTKSGWGFLAILVIAVVLSFTVAGAAAAAGIGAGAAGGTAAGAAASGLFGTALASAGGAAFTGLTASIAFEAAVVGGLMMLGGANLNQMMSFSPSAVYGKVKTEPGFLATLPELEEVQLKLNLMLVKPTTESDFVNDGGGLTSFRKTVVGNCVPGQNLNTCAAGNTGVVQHADQYAESNQVQFLRDNYGQVIQYEPPENIPGK